jgi:hypothetical protein
VPSDELASVADHNDASAHPPRRIPLDRLLQAAINAYFAEHNASPKPVRLAARAKLSLR